MALTIRELSVKLKLDADNAGLAKAQKALTNLKDTAKKLAVGLAGASAGLVALTRNVAQTAEKFGSLSARFGIATEDLQAFVNLAESTGLGFEQATDGIKDLTQRLGQMKKDGTDAASKALKGLGISMKDSAVKGKDTLGVMLLVADKFAAMEDGPNKAAAAVALFGEAGIRLIPTLNMGSKAIAENRKEMESLGAILGSDTTSKTNEFNATMHKLGQVVTGFKNTIALALMPVITKLTARISAWAKENKEVISTKIVEFGESLVSLFEALVPAIIFVADNIESLTKLFIAFKVVQIGVWIAQTIDFMVLFGRSMLATGSSARLMWAAVTGPVGLVILGVTAIIALFIKYPGILKAIWKGIKAVFGFAFDVFIGYITFIADVFKWLWGGLKAGANLIADFFDNTVINAFADAIDWVVGKFKSFIKLINKIPGIGIGLGGMDRKLDVNHTMQAQRDPAQNKLREGFTGRVDTIRGREPALSRIEAPEVTNNIQVFLGTKDIKEISRNEAKTVVTKTIQGATNR